MSFRSAPDAIQNVRSTAQNTQYHRPQLHRAVEGSSPRHRQPEVGIARKAEPLTRLQRRHETFAQRMRDRRERDQAPEARARKGAALDRGTGAVSARNAPETLTW